MIRADVLIKTQLSGGLEDAAKFCQCRPLVGDRTQHPRDDDGVDRVRRQGNRVGTTRMTRTRKSILLRAPVDEAVDYSLALGHGRRAAAEGRAEVTREVRLVVIAEVNSEPAEV